MSAASSALETLEAVRGWSQRLALNLESGESLAAAPLIDLLEIIEAARRELPGGNLSWPTETDCAYRFGLVLVKSVSEQRLPSGRMKRRPGWEPG